MDLRENTERIEEYKARARGLVAQMDLKEKVFQMLHDAPAIPRLGIPAYNWWNEALHGVARAGTATVFPQAIGLAASFDEDLLEQVADAISTEARAKFNAQQAHGDRENIGLPGRQEALLKTICESGRPVVLLLQSGSALAVNWAAEHVPAIMQCWYPGAQGGRAVAETIFGECAPEGKLPVTFYRSLEQLPDFTDYAMAGRTYRYMADEPLYPFGYGLSYTTFSVTDAAASAGEVTEQGVTVRCTVRNTGSYTAGTAVQVYVKAERPGTPNAQLKGLKKLTLAPGAAAEVSIRLPAPAFSLCDENGDRRVETGRYSVYVGLSQPDRRSCVLMGFSPVGLTLTCQKSFAVEA